MDNRLTYAGGPPDLVITNVTIIDAVQGVVKADVGIRDGRICAIGKSGNPQTMDGVTPGLELGLATDAISGNHLILTAAGVDTHIHFISPQQAYAALSNGTTTLIGGGTGPTDGSNATTVTPGPGNIRNMLRAFEGWPVNVGILGKGHGHGKDALVEQIEAGAVGFKCHEDWGTTPAVLRSALTVADQMDVQVCMHTDTLNESGFVEDTIAAFEGRTIHSFHTEGSGGGHAPDIIKVSGLPNVLPASTNPTLPYGVNSQAELYDMIMVCHHLSPDIPSDVAFTESRIRAETIAAENVLQDMGVISIFSSDSQAMGRIGECWLRCIQTADAMKTGRGKLPEDAPGNDNFRVLRYVAKITINPAVAHGIGARAGFGRGRQDRRPGAVGAGVLRRQAQDRAEGRRRQLGGDGRPERVAADAAADLLSADVRLLRPAPFADVRDVRVAGRGVRRNRRAPRPAPAGDRREEHAQDRQEGHGAQFGHAEDRGLARDVRGDRRRRARDGAAAEDDLPQPEVLLQLIGASLILIEKVLGNAGDPEWAARLAAGTVEPLALDHWEAQKNRFRKKTASGREVAVSLDRGAFLRDGDVLLWDAEASRAVVARISLRDVMIIHLDELAAQDPEYAMRTCVELGHALGNQHWPALVKGTRVFVPLTVDHKVMASVMKTHRFEGIRYEFVPGEDIVPYLAPHESRRLFGGAEGPLHTHTQDRYVAVDPETGHVHGRSPVRAHAHPHVHPHTDVAE